MFGLNMDRQARERLLQLMQEKERIESEITAVLEANGNVRMHESLGDHVLQKKWMTKAILQMLQMFTNCVMQDTASFVWNDLKSRVRARLASTNKFDQGRGGGPNLSVPLSAQEERVANIIGHDVEPLDNVAQDPVETTSNTIVVDEIILQKDFDETIGRSGSDGNQPHEDVSSTSPSPQPPLSLPPPLSAPSQATESLPHSQRERRQRQRARRSAPHSPRPSRVQTQAQSSRFALDESRAMVMRIEELRAQTDQILAQSALRQAEAAKTQAEAARAQADAAMIAANAERLKAEAMAGFYESLSSLVPSISVFLQKGSKRAERILSEEDDQ